MFSWCAKKGLSRMIRKVFCWVRAWKGHQLRKIDDQDDGDDEDVVCNYVTNAALIIMRLYEQMIYRDGKESFPHTPRVSFGRTWRRVATEQNRRWGWGIYICVPGKQGQMRMNAAE